MSISLSEHFTYKKLLRFVFPSIIMMIFTSIYSVVDGLFVSNFVGKTALAAINLIMPFIMGISALGFMIGTGGSAIVAKTLGEQKEEKAIEYFLFWYMPLPLAALFYRCSVSSLPRLSHACSVHTVSYLRIALYMVVSLLFP